MKKAKIILPAIGLLSIVGGALAFKAQHKFNGHFFCYTTTSLKFVNGQAYTVNSLGPTLFCTTHVGAKYIPTLTQPVI